MYVVNLSVYMSAGYNLLKKTMTALRVCPKIHETVQYIDGVHIIINTFSFNNELQDLSIHYIAFKFS